MTPVLVRWRHIPGEASSHTLLRSAARCYQTAFGYDRVWNAGWWCRPCSTPDSERRFNFSQPVSSCPDCGGPLEERWPEATLIAKFADELTRPGTIAQIALIDGEVVGGCTGLLMPASQLQGYLSLPDAVTVQLYATLRADAVVVMQDLAFVAPAWQGRGLGRRLYAARHAQYPAHAPEWLLTRTARTPATTVYRWRLREGYCVLAEYQDALDRVLLGVPYAPEATADTQQAPLWSGC